MTFTYTGQRITGITDPLSRTVTFSYSGAGDLTSMVDMRGKTWAYTYDSEHRMLTNVDPNNHTVLTNTYGSLGRVKSQKDAKNAEIKFEYDSMGGITYVIDPRLNTTTYNYDTSYRVAKVYDPYSNYVQYYYDASNNLTRIADRRIPLVVNDTYFTYDTKGNVLTRKNDLNNTWTYTYNSY